ncbi:hypothetical protein JVU11DRAFT_9212 [Chiua virens]|nr:hypothetical protein JVU11DRAFT_9212 [Chiua virens]
MCIVSAIADVAIVNWSGAQVKYALEQVVCCFSVKAWEDKPLVQLSVLQFNALLNCCPLFGFDILATTNEFPRYHLNMKELKSSSDLPPQRAEKHKWGETETMILLVMISDMVFIDFRHIIMKALNENKEFTLTAQLTNPSQVVNAYIASIHNIPVSCLHK